MPEVTAYHEAGHVWAALHVGAQVLRVTIDPEWDDGPTRYGDTQVAWPVGRMEARELQYKSALVALAGPVAEMIHLGQPCLVQTVAEWQADWLVAWEAAAGLAADHERRESLLECVAAELFQLLNKDANWAALATIVDHLVAHETLDQEMINEIITAG